MIFGRGAEFLREGEQADEKSASADQSDAGDKNESDDDAEPVEKIEGDAVSAGEDFFFFGERRHDFGAFLIQEIGDADELVAFGLELVNDFGQRGDGVAAIAAAIVHDDDVSWAALDLLNDALDDGVGGRRRNVALFAPVVRVDMSSDEKIA